MKNSFYQDIEHSIETLKADGLYKQERIITSPQSASIDVNQEKVINLCANNYLGLADDHELVAVGQQALEKHGYGMASVRFICGTQSVHVELEEKLSRFLEKEDTILYSSCFDANAGLFETILSGEDAIISDELNHASIIDGVRLCKAQRFRYKNNDMQDLEAKLQQAQDARYRLIATDGVFSMDGIIADLAAICDLADKYGALVMVDDSHAVGFMGEGGRGTPEFCGVLDRVDIITGTLGKALGGASGGYTSGNKALITWLRQRSRPYLFSNTLTPMIAKVSSAVLDRLSGSSSLREKLHSNSTYFREQMSALGFQLAPGSHPIIPVMLGDAKLASEMAAMLMAEGIYVTGFSYPVVPKGKARIRTQMSASLDKSHLDKAVAAFAKVGKQLQVI